MNRPGPRHRADTPHTPNGPIARALLRGAGLTPTPSGRHADDDALLGLEDVHTTLDRADTRFADVEAQCAEVRRMFDTPIDTSVVTR